ncbi:MAG: hydantoinase/oxoprolinase family protein [Dehalococcoidia bacterium]
MRLAIDIGGTFTDLIVEATPGDWQLFKVASTPEAPVRGVCDVLERAAHAADLELSAFLSDVDVLIHGTTKAINAILTGSTAKTALLTTEGHPDILYFREGGRAMTFDFSRAYPFPSIPRTLTYEIPERIGAMGEVVKPMDEAAVSGIIEELDRKQIEAVAVCLLWSITNPAHEKQIGALLDKHLPGVPYTLSHELNPTVREFRRASSTALDASLKPGVSDYVSDLKSRLKMEGFKGRLLISTSAGGVLDAAAIVETPIHAVMSGPAMAPVAGKYYASIETGTDLTVVTDAGGTSYDVSLVRRGEIPRTRETWIGERYTGYLTGFPAVDVRSIGAGGGSIASVDDGGALRVGPQSAGAVPGPACYGKGGRHATVTDAAVVLGYIDADFFLDGTMSLDVASARSAIATDIGSPLGLETRDAAAAIMEIATEEMVGAIEEITINQGVDPRAASLVGGGGAAGLNIVKIARRLGSPMVVIPDVGAALSAAGGLMSDLVRTFSIPLLTGSQAFKFQEVNAVLEELADQSNGFIQATSTEATNVSIQYAAEARYPRQIWELEVPLRHRAFKTRADVDRLCVDFHGRHEEIFAINDPESPIEIVAWSAHVRCRLTDRDWPVIQSRTPSRTEPKRRPVYFSELNELNIDVLVLEDLRVGEMVPGPAIVESSFTTVVVDPGATMTRTVNGSLYIEPFGDGTKSARSHAI